MHSQIVVANAFKGYNKTFIGFSFSMNFFGEIPLKTKFLVLEIFYINFINLMKMTTPTPSDNIHCPKIKLNSDLL